MDSLRLFRIVGAVVGATGLAMLTAVVSSLIYQEWGVAAQVAGAAAITTATGYAMWRSSKPVAGISAREGFAAVGLSWIAITVFGTLPFLFTGAIPSLTDAFFETAAGYSTTGSSILPDPAVLPHGLLLWRALTQWLGGMGIIVLSVAVLPLLGIGGVDLVRAESPGPVPDRLTPRFRETAKRLWLVYTGLTAIEVVVLLFGDMTLFEAIVHSLTTLSTGGFGTDAASLGAFSAYTQWVVIVFMALAGVSFSLHYRALRDPRVYRRSAEFKLYAVIIVAAAFIIAVGTWSSGQVATVVRDAVFTAVSLVTTTGYGTVDFGMWGPALQVLVLGLMFIGGMSGSTGGSMTPYRLAVLTGAARSDLRRVAHPRGVFVVRFDKAPIPSPIIESVQSFFLLYMFIFMTGTLMLAVIAQASGTGFDVLTSVSASASALGNIGPGLGALGPSSDWSQVPTLSKWLLSFMMLVGRLEIYPILLLFTRELWRR